MLVTGIVSRAWARSCILISQDIHEELKEYCFWWPIGLQYSGLYGHYELTSWSWSMWYRYVDARLWAKSFNFKASSMNTDELSDSGPNPHRLYSESNYLIMGVESGERKLPEPVKIGSVLVNLLQPMQWAWLMNKWQTEDHARIECRLPAAQVTRLGFMQTSCLWMDGELLRERFSGLILLPLDFDCGYCQWLGSQMREVRPTISCHQYISQHHGLYFQAPLWMHELKVCIMHEW